MAILSNAIPPIRPLGRVWRDPSASTGSSSRVHSVALRVVVGSLAVYLLVQMAFYVFDPHGHAIVTSTDAQLYRDAGHRILAGGPIYPAFQLAGPYGMDQRPELYPPPTMLLVVAPMSALPEFLWWVVPLLVTTLIVVWHRPSLVGWTVILACMAWPNTGFVIAAGNPVLYAAMFVALGTIWRGVALLALVKPSLAPFALVGIRSRAWWQLALAYGALGLLMLPLWLDWVTLLSNAQGLDLLYSIGHIPVMLIPVVAMATSQRRSHGRLDSFA